MSFIFQAPGRAWTMLYVGGCLYAATLAPLAIVFALGIDVALVLTFLLSLGVGTVIPFHYAMLNVMFARVSRTVEGIHRQRCRLHPGSTRNVSLLAEEKDLVFPKDLGYIYCSFISNLIRIIPYSFTFRSNDESSS
jgi:hypothetical protein